MGFAAGTVEQALASIEAWHPYGLDWVEDPFLSSDANALAELRTKARGRARLGAGDEAPPSDLVRIMEHDAADIIRCDVTTTGGLSGIVDLTAQSDRRVSFHVYPEIHRHLACVLPEVEEIELFLPGDPFDFADRFIRAVAMDVEAGTLFPPRAPGLGFVFDPSGFENRVTRSHQHNAR